MPQSMTSEQRFQIQDLFADYSWALDLGDIEAFGNVFEENGALDLPRGRRFVGRTEIRQYASGLAADATLHGRRVHHVGQLKIKRISEDTFHVRSMTFGLGRYGTGATSIVFVGHYDDTLCLRNDALRFKQRVFRYWEPDTLPAPDLSTFL